MQRRRRKKAAPKNIFGSGSQTIPKSKPTSSPKPNPPRSRSQIAPPPSVPGAKPKPKQTKPIKTETQPVDTTPETQEKPTMEDELSAVDDLTVEETPLDENQETIVQEKEEVDILEEQILGNISRKDIGLKKELTQTSESKADDEKQGKSQKARQIIQDSMIKASIAVEEAKTLKKKQADTPIKKDPPKKPQRKFRNKTSSYQPANRARRLDRSRHMEYKYEMRGLLSDIGIAEEHRSNLLATIWARGERQTTNEAKEFLLEKLNEGIIDEDQMSSLVKVVDGYTVRR